MQSGSTHAFFYAKLAALTNAGFPLAEAVTLAAQEQRAGKARLIYAKIAAALRRGSTLAGQLPAYPQTFSSFECALIGAGEQSGRLPEVFQTLAAWCRFKTEGINRLRSGLLYPLLLLHAFAFISPVQALLLGKITSITYLYAVGSGLLPLYATAALLFGWSRQAQRTRHFDALLQKVPVLGKGLFYLGLSRFCLAFRALYAAGHDLQHSIALARGACGNHEVANAFLQCERHANGGYHALWQGIAANVPADFIGLWRAGEESGKLEETLQRLTEHWQERAKLEINHFAQWLPRLLYGAILVSIAIALARGQGNSNPF